MCCGRSVQDAASLAYVSPTSSKDAISKPLELPDRSQFGWQKGKLDLQPIVKKFGAYYTNGVQPVIPEAVSITAKEDLKLISPITPSEDKALTEE